MKNGTLKCYHLNAPPESKYACNYWISSPSAIERGQTAALKTAAARSRQESKFVPLETGAHFMISA